MKTSDPLSDLLNRLRNGMRAGHDRVDVPASRIKEDVLRVLADEGYIGSWRRVDEKGRPFLRVGLKYAIGGPLGLVLTVAAGASMIGYLFKNQKDIVKKVGIYKGLIQDTKARYEEIQDGWRSGRYDATERNLMVDGLLKRFLQQCDEA